MRMKCWLNLWLTRTHTHIYIPCGTLWRPSCLSAIHSSAWVLPRIHQLTRMLSLQTYTLLIAQSYIEGVFSFVRGSSGYCPHLWSWDCVCSECKDVQPIAFKLPSYIPRIMKSAERSQVKWALRSAFACRMYSLAFSCWYLNLCTIIQTGVSLKQLVDSGKGRYIHNRFDMASWFA